MVAVVAAIVEVRRRTDSSNSETPGSTVNANAKRSAAFGGNVNSSTIVTGNKNFVGNEVDGDNVGRDKIINIHSTSSSAAASLTQAHEIPPPPADFTGREDELRELLAAIEVGGVTISGLQGMGGIGKTVLALKLAELLKPRYPDPSSFSISKARAPNRSPWLKPWPTSFALTIPPPNFLIVKASCVDSIFPCSIASARCS